MTKRIFKLKRKKENLLKEASKELKKKTEKVSHHSGIKKIEKVRIIQAFIERSPVAKSHPNEFQQGLNYIKTILTSRTENQLKYATGRFANYFLKEHPEFDNPNVVKCILIGMANPELTLAKINHLVADMYSTEFVKAKQEALLMLLRDVNKKKYGFILD